MPELRQDPVTKRWVVVAKERAKRPDDFVKRDGGSSPRVCPFEYGNESMTPPETLAFRPGELPPDSPDWTIRVVPNKFPVFTPENHDETINGLYLSRKAYGAHEVIIHGPQHELSLATYPTHQVAEVLRAYKLRYNYHKNQPYARYIQIIINHGKSAGASLEHSHSQLFVAPVLPELPAAQLHGAAEYYNENGHCIYCKIISQELDINERVVEKTDNFLAFVPFAAKLPFETWIVPLRHRPKFEDISNDEIEELAFIFGNTLRRFYNGLNDPPYNMYLHTSPPGYGLTDTYHWHMSIIPKLTIPAGFELGTGMWIDITIPEAAAKFLRNAAP
ncbi:hypothetical protein [Candidatus Aquicultor secundus]|uniref:Galactose-1-phosphate uridylyltransferase n=1 Tax=Candidatus Aquicultor secundus TaxID=1973895 RepID=A0A2M7T5J3_9ACTN|nr:hypothetical protein [Candidatus Aquicultor secundus]PIZ35521.1 MAG: galactose-1-phosphate uridylyltransferase [Candidatus Aquicultor secundus]